MAFTVDQLTEEAMRLTSLERAELADKLVLSIDFAEDSDVQQQWLSEAEQRLSGIRAGKTVAIPGEQVLAEARALFDS